jgi:hypothetical protein
MLSAITSVAVAEKVSALRTEDYFANDPAWLIS